MLVAGFDTETTGLNVHEDNIIQVGVVLWDTDLGKAMLTYDSYVKGEHITSVPEETTKVHGITLEQINTYGNSFPFCASVINLMFDRAEYVVAHNGNIFDRPMYENNCRRLGLEPKQKQWIDTTCDIEYPASMATRKLSYLAAEHGFLNPFPHNAISDVLTMLKVANEYDWAKIVECAKAPTLIVRADVSFQKKELAKKQAFKWDGDNKVWIKSIKDFQLETTRKAASDAGFNITVVKGA